MASKRTRRGGREGGGQQPSQFNRAIFLFRFYFTNILDIFFSFATCSMHAKTHTKTQEMALKRLYFSKFYGRACLRIPLKILASSGRVRQIVAAPPKFLSPYAYEARKLQNNFHFFLSSLYCKHVSIYKIMELLFQNSKYTYQRKLCFPVVFCANNFCHTVMIRM